MKLVLLLLVLAIRRFELPVPFQWQAAEPFARFSQWLEASVESLRLPVPVLWGLQILLPVLLLAWLLAILAGSYGGILAWVLVVVLVLAVLGTRSVLWALDEYIVYRRMGSNEAAQTVEESLRGRAELPLFERLLLQEARYFFAPVFYVVVLGYWAAILYVLNMLLAQREGRASELARIVDNAL